MNEAEPAEEYVHMAITEDTVSYLMEAYEYNIPPEEHEALVNDHAASPSHVESRMPNVAERRLLNALRWALVLLLLPGAMASTMTVITILSLLASTLFLLGRWSRMELAPCRKVHCVDATTQTEGTTVSGRTEIEMWTSNLGSSKLCHGKPKGLGPLHCQHELCR